MFTKVLFSSVLAASVGLATTAVADLPEHSITFPSDDYSHNDDPSLSPLGFYAEWWYFSGKVEGFNGRDLGIFVSFHNHRLPFFSSDRNLVLAAVTDLDNNQYHFTPIASGGAPFAVNTIKNDKLYVEYQDSLTGGTAMLRGIFTPPHNRDKTAMQIKTSLSDPQTGVVTKYDLILQPVQDALLVNGGKVDMPGSFNGIPNGESYYYSKTRILVSGTVAIGSEVVYVNPLRSELWMDHQWGDFGGSSYDNWEWFSLRMDANGDGINDTYGNIFGFFDKATNSLTYGYSSFIMPDGSVRHDKFSNMVWERSNYITTPKDYEFPLTHHMEFDEIGLVVTVSSMIPEQYDDNLYEGICSVTGTLRGKTIRGYAYKELNY